VSVPRAQQVLRDQIALRPERYTSYHKDLIEILNDELRAIADSVERPRRRKNLVDAIKAKATQIPATEVSG
jgi:hypothetical protein